MNLLKNLKKFYNLVKPFGATTTSKPNFYYIVYDMIYIYIYIEREREREREIFTSFGIFNCIYHLYYENLKESFCNIVLITLLYFLKICVGEKMCKNTYNVV